jgi:hypothetical protein
LRLQGIDVAALSEGGLGKQIAFGASKVECAGLRIVVLLNIGQLIGFKKSRQIPLQYPSRISGTFSISLQTQLCMWKDFDIGRV